MSFSTHGSSQLKRDKLNAKSIKRRGSFFKKGSEKINKTEKEGIKTREVWPHQIKAVKEKMKLQKTAERKKFIKVMLASTVTAIILFLALGWLIRFVFFE